MQTFILVALLAVTTLARAQVPTGVQPFSSDEIEIYRQFLLHFQDFDNALSYIIGMDPSPVPFKPDRDGFRKESVKQALEGFAYTQQPFRRLPPQVLELTTEQAVVRRIAAAHNLVDPARLAGHRVGPDGFVKVHFTVSDISFDAAHRRAAFTYRADCGCMGGSGATMIYRRKFGAWRLEKVVDSWVG